MQIFTDGMTGQPSQSFQYVCVSLLSLEIMCLCVCACVCVCVWVGQRNNSFEMRYMFM